MGLFDFLKRKSGPKKIKVTGLKQKELEKIMENENYNGLTFEGLTNKEIKQQERTQQNPAFEITNHKLMNLKLSPKNKTCDVTYDGVKIGTVNKEDIPEDKLDGVFDGYISGGKRKYMDVNNNGDLKLRTKKSRYVLYII